MSEAEEIKLLDPAQVEAEMLAVAEAKANDPAEQAATLFRMYKASYERAIAKLSSRGKTRVLQALVFSPLHDVILPKIEEKEAFYFGDSMLQAKFVMQMEVFKESVEDMVKFQDNVKTETTYGEVQDENTNSES